MDKEDNQSAEITFFTDERKPEVHSAYYFSADELERLVAENGEDPDLSKKLIEEMVDLWTVPGFPKVG